MSDRVHATIEYAGTLAHVWLHRSARRPERGGSYDNAGTAMYRTTAGLMTGPELPAHVLANLRRAGETLTVTHDQEDGVWTGTYQQIGNA